MGNSQLVAIVIRLFAIALAIYAFRKLADFIALHQQAEFTSLSYYSLVGSIVLFLIAILLWLFPQTVTKSIIPAEIKLDKLSIEKETFLSYGLILLGVYFLFIVITDLIYWASQLALPFNLSIDKKIIFAGTFIELAIALFLIFGSRGFSTFILKLRGH